MVLYSNNPTLQNLKIRLTYEDERQVASNHVVISLYLENIHIRDFIVQFMDVEGNPLEEKFNKQVLDIQEELIKYYGVRPEEFITPSFFMCSDEDLDSKLLSSRLAEKLHSIIVGTCYKRKVDLVDFYDDDSWVSPQSEYKPTSSIDASRNFEFPPSCYEGIISKFKDENN